MYESFNWLVDCLGINGGKVWYFPLYCSGVEEESGEEEESHVKLYYSCV